MGRLHMAPTTSSCEEWTCSENLPGFITQAAEGL